VAANHDLPDVEREHREFHHRRHAAEHLAISRHDVADVAAHEKLAGARLRDHFRRYARIRAGNEERMRRLLAREALEQRFAVGEHETAEVVGALQQVQQVAGFGAVAFFAHRFVGHGVAFVVRFRRACVRVTSRRKLAGF